MTDKTQELDSKLADALATIEKLQESVTKLEGFNNVLKQENKEARSKAEAAEAAREEAAERAEREAKDIEAIEKRLIAKFQKDIEKLTGERDALSGELRTIRVDNELSRALRENVRDGMGEVLEGYLRSKVQYEGGNASIDGKPIADFVTDYLGSDAGAHFRRGSDHSGAGAAGNTNKPPVQHGFTKDNFNAKMGEWMVLAGTDAATAKQIALDVGRSDLASTL